MTTLSHLARSFLGLLKEMGWPSHLLLSLCLVLPLSVSNLVYPAEVDPKGLESQDWQQDTASDAYLSLKGVALGVRLHKRGVVRAELAKTLDGLLEERRINLIYKQAILAGYDRGPVYK